MDNWIELTTLHDAERVFMNERTGERRTGPLDPLAEPFDPPADTPADWQSPSWGAAGRVHEWKNYISDEVRAMWHTFTDEQKQAFARQADEIAGREDWE